MEETFIILAFCAVFKYGKSKLVRWKCPKWLVANVTSYPYLDNYLLGNAITPALFINISIFVIEAYLNSSTQASTDLKSERSSLNSKGAIKPNFLISNNTYLAFYISRAPMIN